MLFNVFCYIYYDFYFLITLLFNSENYNDSKFIEFLFDIKNL